MNSRPQTITPGSLACAYIAPRTAAILANERVLSDPRPPYAPRYMASPENTGTSLGGRWIRSVAIGGDQFNPRHLLHRAATRAGVFSRELVAVFLRRHLAHEPFAGIDPEPRAGDHIVIGALNTIRVNV